MKACEIVIELQSDLCVSDGGAYNAMLDTDVCYDRYGIPYIPAKRIRGCLRECALELKDWGADLDIASLFGDKGDAGAAACVRIGNAHLQGYRELQELANTYKDHVMMHPQNVLSAFTYVRMQTSIDPETGVAKDTSLRSMRVIDKGLRFVADTEVKESVYTQLADCCAVLRHMGLSRTRGFGEVKVWLQEKTQQSVSGADHVPYQEGATVLHYRIDLKEPMICKSIQGEESNTQDYIEGSKMLGIIAQHLSGDFITFMNRGKLRCSNAYLSKNGMRYTEIPAYLFSIKKDKSKIVNKLYEKTADIKIREQWGAEQKNPVRHCYYVTENGRIQTEDVVTEKNNHHRRPEDKSIGYAVAGRESDFYQIDSIAEGQSFAGFAEGSPEQIRKIYDLLASAGDLYMGYSKTSEYGKVNIRIVGMERPQESGTIHVKRFAVRLVSPAIIYNEKAMATTDPEDLKKEIFMALGITENGEVVKYLRFTTVGGYNTTWNKRKPIISAFDKGTVYDIELADTVTLPDRMHFWIGERTSEGYGECVIEEIAENGDLYITDRIEVQAEQENKVLVIDDALKLQLCKPLLDAFLRDYAVMTVNRNQTLYRTRKSVMKPTISNMILMAKENHSFDAVEESVRVRYDKRSMTKIEKKQVAETVLEDVKNSAADLIPAFEKRYNVKWTTHESGALEMRYLREYLSQIKYVLRDNKEGQENG